MAAYLIIRKESRGLESVVFEPVAPDSETSVPVFTDPGRAQRYIDAAGWSDEFAVAEVEPIEFLKWLMHCHADGIGWLATDPDRNEQMEGRRLEALNLADQLEHAGRHILLVAQPDF